MRARPGTAEKHAIEFGRRTLEWLSKGGLNRFGDCPID